MNLNAKVAYQKLQHPKSIVSKLSRSIERIGLDPRKISNCDIFTLAKPKNITRKLEVSSTYTNFQTRPKQQTIELPASSPSINS